jgi:hypothetical protein
LIGSDRADISDGDEPFYASDINYVERRLYVGDLFDEWQSISRELRTERRFFSDRARRFFDQLFDGIEDLFFHKPNEDQDCLLFSEAAKLGVIQEWPKGIALYRARRADALDDCTRLVLKPEVELAPPSSTYARAGRMNAEGVSIFYGAIDIETCLAEMRSSIGGYTVLGCFETIKTLRILDFNRLDKAFWDGKTLSYFQSDFNELVKRGKFRRRLHMLISKPVIPGQEDEYIMTQVLAEYLAYVRNINFDGLLFASTQHQGGTNIVLFPKHADSSITNKCNGMLELFPLEYVSDSAEIYRTKEIKYNIPRVDFFLDDSGVHILDSDCNDDDQ